MKLFNEYHSRYFQFSLDLLTKAKASGGVDQSAVLSLARPYGFAEWEVGELLLSLLDAQILCWTGQRYMSGRDFVVPELPQPLLEEQYLQYILSLPESGLFLSADTKEALQDIDLPVGMFSSIQHYTPKGEPLPKQKENVRILLKAIRKRRMIRHQYTTRDDDTLRESVVFPWKLEYSAYDRRWWVILYNRQEQRMIKARLDNLKNICIEGYADCTEDEIEAAMDRLLEPEPVVLRVNAKKGALERCFLVFENQLFQNTRRISNEEYELVFRYYRFDESEIIRQLLYLGAQVTLLGPEKLRLQLVEVLDGILDD